MGGIFGYLKIFEIETIGVLTTTDRIPVERGEAVTGVSFIPTD